MTWLSRAAVLLLALVAGLTWALATTTPASAQAGV